MFLKISYGHFEVEFVKYLLYCTNIKTCFENNYYEQTILDLQN